MNAARDGTRAEALSIFQRAAEVAKYAAVRAVDHDVDGAFPSDEVEELHRHGLLMAPFPSDMGGEGLGYGDPDRLRDVLVALGLGSLSLGRLFEGHVNAVALATRYGTAANLHLLREEATAGRPSGVWMAGPALGLERGDRGKLVLRGHKVLCSGSGPQGSLLRIGSIPTAARRRRSQWWLDHGHTLRGKA